MIILFINCSLFPFIDWIISGFKTYETRNKNTLKSIIGKTVYIAETGKHKRPLIRCIATIDNVVRIDSKAAYNAMRKQTRIKKGSVYDFNQETKQKYLYHLSNVVQVKPFTIPDNAIMHGRIYATIDI